MDPPTYGEQLAEASFNGDVSALCSLAPTLQDCITHIDPVTFAMTMVGDVLHRGKNNWLNEALSCLEYIHSCFPGNPWGQQFIDLLVDLKTKTVLDKVFRLDPAHCTPDNLNVIVHNYFDPSTFSHIQEAPLPEDIVYTDDDSYSAMKHRLGYDGICGMIKTRENIEHFRACYSSQLRSYDEMLTAQMDDYLSSVRGHLSELKQAERIHSSPTSGVEANTSLSQTSGVEANTSLNQSTKGGVDHTLETQLLQPRPFSIVLTKLPLPFHQKSNKTHSHRSPTSSDASTPPRRQLRLRRRLWKTSLEATSPKSPSQETTGKNDPKVGESDAIQSATDSDSTECELELMTDCNTPGEEDTQADGKGKFHMNVPNKLIEISDSQMASQIVQEHSKRDVASTNTNHKSVAPKFFYEDSAQSQTQNVTDSIELLNAELNSDTNPLINIDSDPSFAAHLEDGALSKEASLTEESDEHSSPRSDILIPPSVDPQVRDQQLLLDDSSPAIEDSILFTQTVDVGGPSQELLYSSVEIMASEDEEDSMSQKVDTLDSAPNEDDGCIVIEDTPVSAGTETAVYDISLANSVIVMTAEPGSLSPGDNDRPVEEEPGNLTTQSNVESVEEELSTQNSVILIEEEPGKVSPQNSVMVMEEEPNKLPGEVRSGEGREEQISTQTSLCGGGPECHATNTGDTSYTEHNYCRPPEIQVTKDTDTTVETPTDSVMDSDIHPPQEDSMVSATERIASSETATDSRIPPPIVSGLSTEETVEEENLLRDVATNINTSGLTTILADLQSLHQEKDEQNIAGYKKRKKRRQVLNGGKKKKKLSPKPRPDVFHRLRNSDPLSAMLSSSSQSDGDLLDELDRLSDFDEQGEKIETVQSADTSATQVVYLQFPLSSTQNDSTNDNSILYAHSSPEIPVFSIPPAPQSVTQTTHPTTQSQDSYEPIQQIPDSTSEVSDTTSGLSDMETHTLLRLQKST